ncbi:MAG: SAM-dependent methyltransferase [Rhodocyclaceae bacterium]|nr:SAM-dependent methyltransferase [Rhodocyclaceae bacterium]
MPGYQVKVETIAIGDEGFVIRSLLDREQFSDPLGAAELAGISTAAWPIFGLVWPSARILAGAMLSFEIAGKRILEIGSGLALASLVLHRRRGDITASDCHPLAEAFLLENLHLNRLPPLKYATGNWARTDPALGLFDLIIGSDVLYDRDQPEVLSGFIDRHSCAKVEVIILDPDRGNRASFCRKMSALGYAHTATKAASRQQSGESYKGRFLNFRRDSHPPLPA